MIWTWYVARDDELMLDIDGKASGSNLGPMRVRLDAALRSGLLKLRGPVFVYRSKTAHHYHVILRLAGPMEPARRFTWEMQLRSDAYRGRCNLIRALDGVPAPGLLIAPGPWPEFYRPADATCFCPGKHDFETLKTCPAAEKLRGKDHAARGYFGRLPAGTRALRLRMRPGPIGILDFLRVEHPVD
jgi:hypothetical protein